MKALLIVLIVLTVILLLPVGIDGGYRKNALVLGLKIGPFNIKVFPRKEKDYSPKKKKAKRERKEHEKPEKEKKKRDFGQALDIISLALDALGRFRRKLSIDYLRIRCAVATGDPFDTAVRCGAVNAAFAVFFTLADEAFNIKERDFSVTPDFLADKTEIDVWLTATLHILDLFYIAIAFGIDYLRLNIKQKRSKPKIDMIERNEANG